MATVFTNKIIVQGRVFALALVLLWATAISYVGYHFIFLDGLQDEVFTVDSVDFITLDMMLVTVALITTVLIAAIGLFAAKMFVSLNDSSKKIAEEQAAVLREVQEKERIKRQLTNNINHELKTPICSILGYLDMILANEAMEPQMMRTFAQKSYDQAERLRKLMANLSTITRIDEASMMIEREDVDLWTLTDDIVADTMPQAKESGISVQNNINRSLMINGNQMLLYSIFRNLIDNAINYSGGRKVIIELTYFSDDIYHFKVSDNGIGVENKHLSHIFERFYRVDKGRSRKIGGTGLGLSIVKNAVLFHGGAIHAQKSPSGGLEFVFSLKVG